MEVNKINELTGKIQGAKISFKYLVASGKLTSAQFVAYCDLSDSMKEFEEVFQKYCESEL